MVVPGEDGKEGRTTEAAGPALAAAESKATATALPNDGGPTAERASQRASLRAAADTGGEPLALRVGSAASAVETENCEPDGAPRHGRGCTGSARARRGGDPGAALRAWV